MIIVVLLLVVKIYIYIYIERGGKCMFYNGLCYEIFLLEREKNFKIRGKYPIRQVLDFTGRINDNFTGF